MKNNTDIFLSSFKAVLPCRDRRKFNNSKVQYCGMKKINKIKRICSIKQNGHNNLIFKVVTSSTLVPSQAEQFWLQQEAYKGEIQCPVLPNQICFLTNHNKFHVAALQLLLLSSNQKQWFTGNGTSNVVFTLSHS